MPFPYAFCNKIGLNVVNLKMVYVVIHFLFENHVLF